MSPDSSCFTSMFHSSYVLVMTIDGTPMPLVGVGSIVIPNLSLSNVYHILNLTLNLAFVGQLCDSGNLVTFFFFLLFCAGFSVSKAD